jgi:glycosyltransferase involved in cell wall biosynthesis
MGELVQSDGPGVRLYRLGLLAQELEARGHDVVRWIPTFIHASKKQRFDGDTITAVSARHHIHHVYIRSYAHHLGLSRLRSHRQFARRWADLQASLPSPDLILTSMPTPDICNAARQIGKSRGLPYVIDVRDLWPDALYESMPSWARRLSRLLTTPMTLTNRRSFRRAVAVTGVSATYVDWGVALAGRRRHPLDQVFVPAYAPPVVAEKEILSASERWQTILSPGSSLSLFLGTLSNQFDFSAVIGAAKRLSAECPRKYEWVICGDGPMLATLQAQTSEMPQVHVPGWVGGADIRALLDLATFGLAPYAGGVKVSLPNKPFEYASAGLPVISSLDGEFRELLESKKFGAYFQAADVEGLIEIFRNYDKDPGLVQIHGAAGRKLWEIDFSASTVYGRMAEYLESAAKAQLVDHDRP